LPVKGRRVRRLIRRIEPWTVLKFSLLLYVCFFAVILVAGIVLWVIAASTGGIHNVEKFIGQIFELNQFKFHAGVILGYTAAIGGILVVLGTLGNVLFAVLYNLISDIVGGIEVSVLEEDLVPAAAPVAIAREPEPARSEMIARPAAARASSVEG
jgi:hypothetical protein